MQINTLIDDSQGPRGRAISFLGVAGGMYMSIPSARARFRSCVSELLRDRAIAETYAWLEANEDAEVDLDINTIFTVLTACEILVSGGEINDVLRVLDTLSVEERGYIACSWDLFLQLPFDDLDLLLDDESDTLASIH